MGIWTFDSWRSISHSASEYDWALFQFAIGRTSLYVLGAGASLPIISRDLASEIERGIKSVGSIPAVPEDPSELKQWMLRTIFDTRLMPFAQTRSPRTFSIVMRPMRWLKCCSLAG